MRRSGRYYLIGAAALAILLALLFPDSCQQDGGYHFLFARWAWVHPELFVGVWARPLFTTLYSVPALDSYLAAKLFSALISVLTAWQTWRLAEDLRLERAQLAIPFLFLQPSFFIICADTMTEPIFALVLVAALRMHLGGRVRAGMVVASFLILARPEGFFIGILWGLWVLWGIVGGRHAGQGIGRREMAGIAQVLLLATGSLIWWLAAWAITGDPMFIRNNWPSSWPVTGTIYGTGGWWNYIVRLPEIVGLLLIPPFWAGLWTLLRERRCHEVTSIFLNFFILHTVLRTWGLLGSAGYPRYFVAISPVVAVLTLTGWNVIAKRLTRSWSLRARRAGEALLLSISAALCFAYFDGAEWIRDARAVDAMHAWFQEHPQPLRRLIWSEAYMAIRFDQDPWENLEFTHDRARDLEALRASPPGTLVFWESIYGPKWHALRAEDFVEAGYRLLHKEQFILRGYILPRSFFGYGGPRHQEMYFFYKE